MKYSHFRVPSLLCCRVEVLAEVVDWTRPLTPIKWPVHDWGKDMMRKKAATFFWKLPSQLLPTLNPDDLLHPKTVSCSPL